MDIKFIKCTLDDFDFLFKLKKENFKKYVDNIWGWNDNDQIERLRIDLEENLEQKNVIIYNDTKVGVFSFYMIENNVCRINEINILKEYQNLGIGSYILENKLKENSDKNIRTILQVFKDNPALNLYKRLGFRIYEETETHYKMEKI